MLQHFLHESLWGPSRLDQCNQILQTPEQFEDIYLMALATYVKGWLMK